MSPSSSPLAWAGEPFQILEISISGKIEFV